MKIKQKKLIIPLICIMFLIVCIVVVLIIKKNKEMKEFNFTRSKEVEYQMGNYIYGGINVDEYTYILVEGDLVTGGEDGHIKDVILRVDSEGNVEDWYTFDEYEMNFSYCKSLFYYDGWLYVGGIKIGDGSLETGNSSVLIRISINDAYSEIIYEDFTHGNSYGVRDGLLFISHPETGVQYLDLSKGLDFDNLEKLEDMGSDKEHYYMLFADWIYNGKGTTQFDDILEIAKKYRQYYDGHLYTLIYDTESDKEDFEGSYVLSRIIMEYAEGEKSIHTTKKIVKTTSIASNVDCFNIYADKIYYSASEEGINNIYCMNVDGSNKTLLYSLPEKDDVKCVELVVSDENIICGMGEWVPKQSGYYYTTAESKIIINLNNNTMTEIDLK